VLNPIKQNVPVPITVNAAASAVECVEHHRQRQQIPACFFPADVEKTYDRSFARFIKACQENTT